MKLFSKKFSNLLESVNSYILNLNTHPAYKDLRNYREKQIQTGKNVTGYELSYFLKNILKLVLNMSLK